MTPKRQKQIEEAANNLLRRTGCYPTDFSSLTENVGIDVERVATMLGIDLIPHDFGEDVSGVLLREGDKAQIGFNTKNGAKRQRFTIAHELGHYVLNHQRKGVFVDTPEKYFALFRDSNSSTGEDIQEREANSFAASLLMPLDLARQGISYFMKSDITRDEDFELVPLLAKRFNVSDLAMSYRLTNLNLMW
ncbi:ImmA/IrrE family metallo-endopeptidase [Spirosoma aerophilum]